ncbi:hypothetical protein Taro_046404 [Colocasia esculenta]|uniref:CCHC-type domain-containing protein n=1 Tax=Colocasia esculenta TaxID=4460 RepID=A0A843WTP9_COLES|nr:hypothetical protein [Colocasia esculenta]
MIEKCAGEEEQSQLDPEVWVAASGPPKKGHVYGFGHSEIGVPVPEEGAAMTSSSKRDARAREHEERRKVRNFIMRLRPSLRVRLFECDPRTLDEALSTTESAASTASKKPKCMHCSKHHGKNMCWTKEGRCLKCGSKDHRIRECPRLKKLDPRGVTTTATKEPAAEPQAPVKENVLAEDDINDITRDTISGLQSRLGQTMESRLAQTMQVQVQVSDAVQAQLSQALS